MHPHVTKLLLVTVLAWQSVTPWATAQEGPASAPTARSTSSADGFAAEEPAAGRVERPGLDEGTFREETVYIPYEKLREVFEKEGRGVFLPYEKFQQLWKAAQSHARGAAPLRRPTEALISEIDSVATIGAQVVDVVATLKVEIVADRWVKVPLRLKGAALRSATIGGAPARIVFERAAGYQLLYRSKTKEPERFELQIEYARTYTKTPGQSSVTFAAPQAPINRWRVHVPAAGTAVQVEPMIAVTRAPQADSADDSAAADVLAFVGAAPSVRIAWNPKVEGAAGLAAFATVQAEQEVAISEGSIRTTVRLNYQITRSKLTQLLLEVPADQKVISVIDQNVKRWELEQAEGAQRIKVDLFEPAQGNQSVIVTLEKYSTTAEASYEVTAPLVRALGVGRQQGIVVARLADQLQGEPVRYDGLLQLDQSDLPPKIRRQPWDFAYRYSAVPYELRLRIEKVRPRISVAALLDAALSTDKLDLDWQAVFTIEDAGVFQLRIEVPKGFEVRSIHGQAVGKSQAAAVESYHRVSDDATTWLVNLSKKALGKVGLRVQLQRRIEDPNLLSPTGKTSTLVLPIPRGTAADVVFSQGAVIVRAAENLRVNPAEAKGLRSVSFADAYRTIATSARRTTALRPVLAYSFSQGAAELSVVVERRRPQVTVKELLQAEVDAGVVKYQASFFFGVKYSSVKSLRIDVPTALVAEIRNVNKSFRQATLTPPPDDVPEGYTAWTFSGTDELLGPVAVRLAWQQNVGELEIGKDRDIEIPRLIPMGVDRAEGQIVISKAESIDVQPTGQPSGLRPIDPQNELMPQAKVDQAAMAFEFVGDWQLTIQATRYELAESKLTSIERAVVRVVALSQGELSVQALYRMRSARQRIEIQLPEGAKFDAQPLRINGQPVTPERGSAAAVFAPLLEQDMDKTFLLELRYSVPGSPARLDLPSFPDDPAVQKVYLCGYVPEKLAILGGRGPWSAERGGDHNGFRPVVTRQNDRDLIGWVAEGLVAGANAARTFPTGKSQLLVYSTLRPDPPPDGSLRLVTMDRRLFNGLVLFLVAAMGLPLLRSSLRNQLLLLLLITAVVLLLGVFTPELTRNLLEGIFPVAIVLVVLLWTAGHISRGWSTLRRSAAHWAARTETTAPPAGDRESADSGEVGAELNDQDAQQQTPPEGEGGQDDAS
jgi:hypothetical protein